MPTGLKRPRMNAAPCPEFGAKARLADILSRRAFYSTNVLYKTPRRGDACFAGPTLPTKLGGVQPERERSMREIGAFEAKNRFGQLLDWVEHGEEVTITRHGKEVARLVPARAGFNREAARAAAQRIRAMSKGVTLGKLKIKDLINEGRR